MRTYSNPIRKPGKKYSGPGNPTHGKASTYRSTKYNCRCRPCTEANNTLQYEENAKRAARLAADPSLAPHGSTTTYGNWGCRCDECKAAYVAKLAADRERRIARLKADPSIVVHGRPATYTGWGCKCEPCRASMRVKRQDA